MHETLQLLFGIAVLAFFIWLFIPTAKTMPKDVDNSGDAFIDPNDSYQIGVLVGLRGGSVPDAAAMRFALQRFQEIHGRRATSRDIGVVLGLIRSS